MSEDGPKRPTAQGERDASDEDVERRSPRDPSGSGPPTPAVDAEADRPSATQIGSLPPPIPGHAGSPPTPIETGEENGHPPAAPDLATMPPFFPPQFPRTGPSRPARAPSPPRSDASLPSRDVAAEMGLEPIDVRPMQLVRVSPRSRGGERVDLDPLRTSYGVGRAESNDVRLYTASASRQHAKIYLGASGYWVIEPLPGRSVTVDDEPSSQPVPLEENMNLVMGQDHLRFESPSRRPPRRVEPAVGGPRNARKSVWVVWAIGGGLLLAAVVVGWLLF